MTNRELKMERFLETVFRNVPFMSDDGTWQVCGECQDEYQGYDALNYWSEGPDYDLGVYIPFLEKLESMGYYVEWWDAGTAVITPA